MSISNHAGSSPLFCRHRRADAHRQRRPPLMSTSRIINLALLALPVFIISFIADATGNWRRWHFAVVDNRRWVSDDVTGRIWRCAGIQRGAVLLAAGSALPVLLLQSSPADRISLQACALFRYRCSSGDMLTFNAFTDYKGVMMAFDLPLTLDRAG